MADAASVNVLLLPLVVFRRVLTPSALFKSDFLCRHSFTGESDAGISDPDNTGGSHDKAMRCFMRLVEMIRNWRIENLAYLTDPISWRQTRRILSPVSYVVAAAAGMAKTNI